VNSNVQVPLESRGSYQIRITPSQTSGDARPTNEVVQFFFSFFIINALSRDINSLIHNQQQSTGALIATNLMHLIIRQGPNLYVISCFPNTRLTISGLGTIRITERRISRTTGPKFRISEVPSSFGEVFISTYLNLTLFNQIIIIFLVQFVQHCKR
jgi:hypothetical protein